MEFSLVYHGGALFLFGGSIDDVDSTIIARLDEKSSKWSRAGTMNDNRRGHRAFHDGFTFLVVGGRSDRTTERCDYSGGEFHCKDIGPSLYSYAYYPEVFLVEYDFCSNETTTTAPINSTEPTIDFS